METYSIAEAATVTGLTKKAVRNRVDRGQLRAVLRDGVRRIPRSELERAGLVGAGVGAAERHLPHEAAPREAASLEVVRELLDRLEKQATEITSLRALTVESESLKLERESLQGALFEAEGRVRELEAKLAQRRRWRLRMFGPAPAA